MDETVEVNLRDICMFSTLFLLKCARFSIFVNNKCQLKRKIQDKSKTKSHAFPFIQWPLGDAIYSEMHIGHITGFFLSTCFSVIIFGSNVQT